ncbi:MAG: methyltransferase domain-containing protein [Proteobacteria bacterium]|nr:methyltransferase domain-containing protein [Pseudomonadota bacterium]
MPAEHLVFDHALRRRRAARAAGIGPATFLLDRVADDLALRLDAVLRRFDVVVDLHTPTPALRQSLARCARVAPAIAVAAQAAGIIDAARGGIVADEEILPFRRESLDLVVSALALHWVNDLPGMLAQIARALKPDGLFLAALIGGETLFELRESFAAAETELVGGISPRVAPMVDVRTLGGLIQRAGFSLPVTDVDRVTVRYDTPLRLMHDLRRMAATNVLIARRHVPLRRATLARMLAIYGERFSDADGRVRATFEIVWASGWAAHASQQQPLPPGSARHRLADALGAREMPAGEKAGR